MNVNFLFNLLNKLGERDKLLFHNEFNKFNNTRT